MRVPLKKDMRPTQATEMDPLVRLNAEEDVKDGVMLRKKET